MPLCVYLFMCVYVSACVYVCVCVFRDSGHRSLCRQQEVSEPRLPSRVTQQCFLPPGQRTGKRHRGSALPATQPRLLSLSSACSVACFQTPHIPWISRTDFSRPPYRTLMWARGPCQEAGRNPDSSSKPRSALRCSTGASGFLRSSL